MVTLFTYQVAHLAVKRKHGYKNMIFRIRSVTFSEHLTIDEIKQILK